MSFLDLVSTPSVGLPVMLFWGCIFCIMMDGPLLGVKFSAVDGSLSLLGSEVKPLVVASGPGVDFSDSSYSLIISLSSSSMMFSFFSGISSTTTFTDSIIVLVLLLKTL